MTDGNPRSPKLPGGDLISAALNHRVMALADRGRASGMIGNRWADLAAAAAGDWPGSQRHVPGDSSDLFSLRHVLRLDDRPEIAARASKRSLQNPDLIFVGSAAGHAALQAADAKFSVETARAKQVSGDVVTNLLSLGALITDLLPDAADGYQVVNGVFLCPDFQLTHLMFRRKYGVVRTTVRPDQVVLVAVDPADFFAPLDGVNLMAILAAIDSLPTSPDEELTVGLYYFRLARAAVGCGTDAKAPLLDRRDRPALLEKSVLTEAKHRADSARSAYDLILAWHAEVELIRRQREAVDRVAGAPIRGHEVRAMIEEYALTTRGPVPSINQVRRRLGIWYRRALVERVGPMEPPIPDLDAALDRLARAARDVSAAAPAQTRQAIADLSAEIMAPADSSSRHDHTSSE